MANGITLTKDNLDKNSSNTYTYTYMYMNWNEYKSGGYVKIYIPQNDYYNAKTIYAYYNTLKGSISSYSTGFPIILTYDIVNNTVTSDSYSFQLTYIYDKNKISKDSSYFHLNEYTNGIFITDNNNQNNPSYFNTNYENSNLVWGNSSNTYFGRLTYNFNMSWVKANDDGSDDTYKGGNLFLPETNHWNSKEIGFLYSIRRANSILSFNNSKTDIVTSYTLGKLGSNNTTVTIFNRYGTDICKDTNNNVLSVLSRNNTNNTSQYKVTYDMTYNTYTVTDPETTYVRKGSVSFIYDKRKVPAPWIFGNNSKTVISNLDVTYNPLLTEKRPLMGYIWTNNLESDVMFKYKTNYTANGTNTQTSYSYLSNLSGIVGIESTKVNNSYNIYVNPWSFKNTYTLSVMSFETDDYMNTLKTITINTKKLTPSISYVYKTGNFISGVNFNWPFGSKKDKLLEVKVNNAVDNINIKAQVY